MSQKKVDQYKKDKANRAQIIKREKVTLAIEKVIAVLILIAAVVWIIFSVYAKVNEGKTTEVVETLIDNSALEDYINTMDTGEETEEVEDEAEEETEEVEDEAEEETEESEDDAEEEDTEEEDSSEEDDEASETEE